MSYGPASEAFKNNVTKGYGPAAKAFGDNVNKGYLKRQALRGGLQGAAVAGGLAIAANIGKYNMGRSLANSPERQERVKKAAYILSKYLL